MTAVDQNIFLREYTRALRDGTAALFVGAGISRSAGYVDWKQLLKEIAEDLNLDINRESDLIALAQYHVNHHQGRDRLNQHLVDEFFEDVELTESHRLIATLPVDTIWTTNYDDLLEEAFKHAKKRTDVKRRATDFATSRRFSDVTVYKMHGDKSVPSETVLTKEDYESYDKGRELFTIALKGDLITRTFLFLGFSFTDPNISYILSRVKQLLEGNSRQHYCIIKRPFECDDEYLCRQFDHWMGDLRRHKIRPVLIDKYDDVPRILKELNRRSHLRDIFISGSAHTFEPLGKERFQNLCRLLGRELVKNDFNVVSGFGVGVGDQVIYGAIQSLPRNDDRRLQLWPFPQEVPSGIDRAKFWREYRERMISHSGISVIISGNKVDHSNIVPANGVREEIDISRKQGNLIVPIGATGYVARETWNEMTSDVIASFGGLDVGSHFAVLGDESASEEAIVNSVIELLRLLAK